jgi:hypothetical protein
VNKKTCFEDVSRSIVQFQFVAKSSGALLASFILRFTSTGSTSVRVCVLVSASVFGSGHVAEDTTGRQTPTGCIFLTVRLGSSIELVSVTLKISAGLNGFVAAVVCFPITFLTCFVLCITRTSAARIGDSL